MGIMETKMETTREGLGVGLGFTDWVLGFRVAGRGFSLRCFGLSAFITSFAAGEVYTEVRLENRFISQNSSWTHTHIYI